MSDLTSAPQDTVGPATADRAPVPDLVPTIQGTKTAEAAAMLGQPVLQPPGMPAAAQPAAAVTSATVGGLYTSNHASNAWVYLNVLGWRRLSAANPDAHQAMLQIARVALDATLPLQCEEDSSVIHAIYAW